MTLNRNWARRWNADPAEPNKTNKHKRIRILLFQTRSMAHQTRRATRSTCAQTTGDDHTCMLSEGVVVTSESDCIELKMPNKVMCDACTTYKGLVRRKGRTTPCAKPWSSTFKNHLYKQKRDLNREAIVYLNSINAKFCTPPSSICALTHTTSTTPPAKKRKLQFVSPGNNNGPNASICNTHNADHLNGSRTTTVIPQRYPSATCQPTVSAPRKQKIDDGPSNSNVKMKDSRTQTSRIGKDEALNLMFPRSKDMDLQWKEGGEFQKTKVYAETTRVNNFLIRLTEGNSTAASQILLKLLRRYTGIKESVVKGLTNEFCSIDSAIANRLKGFIQRLKSTVGVNPKEQKEALIAILAAVFCDNPDNEDKRISDRQVSSLNLLNCFCSYESFIQIITNMELIYYYKVMVRLDTGKNRNTAKIAKEQANKLQTNYSQTYSHIQRKIRSDFTQDLAEECIVQFCHSEIASRIDTNQWG